LKGIAEEIEKQDFVIGVDRAAYWLIAQGIVPDMAIGDFDSCNKSELDEIQKMVKKIKKYSPEKDFTDTELAVTEAIKKKPKELVIYGGVGSRLDHTLASLTLLEQCDARGIPAVFRDETNEVVLVHRGRTILEQKEGMRYVSVLPYTESIQITLSGFSYDVVRKTILRGQAIGISNEFTKSRGEITIHRGKALVIQSRD
jgi:thiamine pyrophosphokinase